MDVKELLKELLGTEEVTETTEEDAEVEGSDDTPEAQEDGPEDASGRIVEMLEGLNSRFDEQAEVNKRVDKIEKVLTQLLTKGAATNEVEAAKSEPEEYVPLTDMDFTTPPPKQ